MPAGYVTSIAVHAERVEHPVVPGLTPASPIRILLVDDQHAIRAGVTALIRSEDPALQLAGSAASGAQALELAGALQPDIVVLDVDLGDEDGLELIPRLRSVCDAAIVVFTCHDLPFVRRRTRELGATALILKSAPGSELIAAIRTSAIR